MNIIKRLNQLS